jgi:hypothetical protein
MSISVQGLPSSDPPPPSCPCSYLGQGSGGLNPVDFQAIRREGMRRAHHPDVFVNESGCWVWVGAVNNKGYGLTWFRRKITTAHRAYFIIAYGAVPTGLTLDHLCRNTRCVNPVHLEPVTHQENMRRGFFGSKTHCPQGHPYAGENLVIPKSGGRRCRTCDRAKSLRYTRDHAQENRDRAWRWRQARRAAQLEH